MADSLYSYLPWTKSPLIVNAPMGGFAGGALAATVTQNRALGMIGAIMPADLEKELSVAHERLNHNDNEDGMLPIGVGLLPFVSPLSDVLPILKRYRPTVVWLFAAREIDDYTTWATAIRDAVPSSRIWIQTGTVAAAVQIAETAKPDALIMQGAEAGGHGFECGAGLIAVLPEAIDALKTRGFGHIPVLASGGIVDARGAAAAFALGAAGVVLGTRFLAAQETNVPPGYRELVLAAKDGATSTVRSKLFDNVKGPNIWPVEYDGRSLVTESYLDFQERGVDIEKVREKHNAAVMGKDAGYGDTNRANIWAGAGVGLVNKVESAKDVVLELRSGISAVLRSTASRL
jgi:nitronate monooxygenase